MPRRPLTDTWQHIGPGGGGHLCRVAFDPSDPARIFIGSDVTGLFRTHDGGGEWDAATRGLSDYYVRSILVHPDDPSMVFVTTGEGVSRSTDGGRSFETVLQLPLWLNPSKYAAAMATITLDPNDPQVVWAAVGGFRFSNVASAGGDGAGEWAHVWTSAAGGAAGTWVPLPGPGDAGGVHSVLAYGSDSNPTHPGSERIIISSTVGVWTALYTLSGDWQWSDASGSAPYQLPHGDARDLEALLSPVGAIDRLYVVLDSKWDTSDTTSAESIYDHAAGYGGGVWYSDDLGTSWHPTSFGPDDDVDISDGFKLEDGATSDAGAELPKNMRHLAIDQQRGTVYTALTVRKMDNEGVWKGEQENGLWTWTRISDSRTDQPTTLNMNLDHFTTLGAIDGLEVQPGSHDVILTTNQAAYRCPGGDCLPGDPTAPWWEPVHTSFGGTSPQTYRTNGMDVTQTFDVAVWPAAPSTWLLSSHDLTLLRSDDAGEHWRTLGTAEDEPYATYGNGARNCRGLRFVPDSPSNETLGIFGSWKDAIFELWSTDGLPDESSTWTQLPVHTSDIFVRDVLLLDGASMLVATDSGIFRGDRSSGSWVFQPDQSGIALDTSLKAMAFAVAPGSGPTRRQIVALALKSGAEGSIYWRDDWLQPWQAASYTPGPTRGMANVLSLSWSVQHENRVYAGNGGGVFSTPEAGVLRSDDGGASWVMISQAFADFDASCFDVKGLAVLPAPALGSGAERIYAGLASEAWWGAPPCTEATFGGVFVSSDGGLTWQAHNRGLDAGHTTFLKSDPAAHARLFYGTLGNGAYSLSAQD